MGIRGRSPKHEDIWTACSAFKKMDYQSSSLPSAYWMSDSMKVAKLDTAIKCQIAGILISFAP
eukprot:CAMPEP_0177758106 /NCGR_PEP_ID=MMETSP0491_2-20121128/4010_1 /TAXON_ID=63592 /ORGANISM="Tetraselmis chuii, Strain PLY429" /LENGTH=62 /DNA_ID=CAMNT_0019273823 /DNA_START=176 /DNA_END=364 /DNA_ORIENTATION=-